MFKPMNHRLFILFILLSFSLSLHAEITASIDRPSIFFGESLTLTITSDQNTTSEPDFSMLDAVFHVGQTGKSSSTQIINGEVSSQTTWQVLLVPKSLGSHIIPPIDVDGERTQAIKIEVKKPDPKAQAKGDIFLEIETDKTEAFVQEEILLTVRLLYAIQLKSGTLSEPGASGVIVQQINKGANYTTQRNGKTYQVLERKYAIFAENSGPLTLNPIVFDGEVTDNSRQSLGLFQRGRPIRQVSEMIDLTIKQIPQNFINKSWIPAKEVKLQQSWSQNKPYQVGEPVTRTITFTAKGLSETQLPDIDIGSINNAKIYQDKTDTMTRTDGQQLIASKVIKYAVIPNQPGSLEIPEFTLEWYDTGTQTAQTAVIPPTTLNIEPSDSSLTKAPDPIDFNQTNVPKTQAIPSTNEVVVYKDNKLWLYLTAVFAVLWIITLTLLLIKPSNKSKPITDKDQSKTVNINTIRHINQADPTGVQNQLIAWWNQEYNQHTTNLSQILIQLTDSEMKNAIDQLQQNIYQGSENSLSYNWYQLIKQGQFKPAQTVATIQKGLPELYQ